MDSMNCQIVSDSAKNLTRSTSETWIRRLANMWMARTCAFDIACSPLTLRLKSMMYSESRMMRSRPSTSEEHTDLL